MVHRPSDSRLLVNLLSHEKDYAKQLSTLLETSHASLSSFSAYASASAPPASQIIIQVAGALAGADEALRKYALSLEQWQNQLRSLKDLEDEVGNIMRDREILVTRLIKVSKQQKPTRDVILATSSSSSTLSIARPEVQIGSKLATAQSELQACETHLASKEKELDVMRMAALRSGLSARCKALVECGWTWGEMGKEGLRALETLGGDENGYAHPLPPKPSYARPFSENGNANGHAGDPSSDLSSIGPSQSASQNTHLEGTRAHSYTLSIPPAHAISDHTFPGFYGRESESGGSSAEEEGRYVVQENPRFSAATKGKGQVVSAPSSTVRSPKRTGSARGQSPSSNSSPNQSPKTRPRRVSTSVFGSIAAFFHHNRGSSVDGDRGRDLEYDTSPTRSRSHWQTRTDRNLTRRRNDSDDDIISTSYSMTLPPSVITDSPNTQHSSRLLRQQQAQGSQRLKKRNKRSAASTSVVAGSPARSPADGQGQAGEGAAGRPVARSGKDQVSNGQAGPSPASPITPSSQTTIKASDLPKERSAAHQEKEKKHGAYGSPIPPQGTLKGKKPENVLPAALPTEVIISRSNSLSKRSILSTASAPVGIESQPDAAMYHATPAKHSTSASHKRAASLDGSGTVRAATAKSGRKTGPAARSQTSRTDGHGEQSLMSIVEGVAKQNRKHRAQQDPSAMLFVAKAPPSIGASIDAELHALHNVPISRSTEGPHRLDGSPGITREASERSVPLTSSVPSAPTLHVPSPDLKPLRSAMRNASRSPSPNASITLPPATLSTAIITTRSKLHPSPPRPPPRDLPPIQTDLPVNGNRSPEFDDVSSISSYETTSEMLDDDTFSTPQQSSPSPPLPPPSSPPPLPPKPLTGNGTALPASGSDTSQSTSTTSNSAQPQRRKSVRMSLPPTFSTTPPALDDDDASVHTPWSTPREQHTHRDSSYTGWSSRIIDPAERDMWQDSSDEEDTEYALAKRLLLRTPKKKQKR